MARDLIRRIERTALVLGFLATAASVISLDPRVVGGVFIGAAIGWLNLAAVRLLFERGARTPERGTTVLVAFLVKSVLLLVMVSIVVLVAGVDGIAFIVGFSVAVLAVLAVSVVHLFVAMGVDARSGGSSEGP